MKTSREYRICKFPLIILLLVVSILHSAYCERGVFNPQADSLFAEGVKNYTAGRYRIAVSDFRRILTELPPNQRSSAAQLMLAKSFYKLGEYDRAIEAARELLRTYPQSRYVSYCFYLIGGCHFRQGRYVDAVVEYAKVVNSKGPSRLKQRAQKIINWLVKAKLSPSQVEALRRRGLIETPVFPAKPVPPQLPTVGLLCPISGPDSTFGQQLRDGVKLAFEEAGNATGLSLVVEDTKSSAIGAVKAAQKLAAQPGVVALIGPVFSLPTIAAAAVANCHKIPLIAPTANQEKLTTIGEYIFQLNTTPGVQAERIAEYAIKDLGLDTLAVLTPLNSRGQQMSTAFVRRARELGAEIVAQEWYTPGATDFSTQLQEIRRVGLSLLPPDSLKAIQALQDTTETLVPLTTIKGFLVVGTPQDLVLIAPQIVFWRIETQLLGGNGWNSLELINQGGRYVKGALFVAEYFAESDLPAHRLFVGRFTQKYGRSPTKVAAFGYDAARLILQAWEKGARNRNQLREALTKTWKFQGASTEISLRQRANQSVFLLTIRGDRIVKVGLLR